MTETPPPPGFGRRTTYCLLAGMVLGLGFAAVALVLNLYDLNVGAQPRMAELVLPLLGESTAAGLIGGLMAAASRWLWATGVTGTAVTAGVGACGIGAIITFGLLAATLTPVAQVLWILLLGPVIGAASMGADRHLALHQA
ncbi:hypothetical protein [Nesterenkonia muleiensis]|uniref:hypothetical protein n=1 Tax=Nesterenkonia muleiensis TaxID=2282648 RepID=UPI000E71B019|nr:hypothetical protein [Nesterenkonia muleiensis]